MLLPLQKGWDEGNTRRFPVDETDCAHTSRRSHQSPLLGIGASILIVAVILGVLVHFGAHEQILRLLKWFDAQGAWVSLLFILTMAAVVVLVLPGVLFPPGAGFVFGIVEGSIYVVTGTTLGAVLAFLIARYLFGQRARRFILARSRLHVVSNELTAHGWKIVLLTRLIRLPRQDLQLFLRLTPFSLRGYTAGSLLGFIPFSCHNVYLGSIVADLSTLGVHDLGRTPLEWGLYGAGFIATVSTVIYLNRLARRALARYQTLAPLRRNCRELDEMAALAFCHSIHRAQARFPRSHCPAGAAAQLRAAIRSGRAHRAAARRRHVARPPPDQQPRHPAQS